jgi:hypothetical protein
LKENFDRINFASYKEKQMADFRKWLIALAVLALMAGAASAQVGTASGSANSLLACTATAAGTPELRPEGYTELAGDIVISCTGGPTMQLGASIPTTNIIVYMAPAVPITSRFLSSNGASEALLIIDEAGSTIGTGVGGNYGPKATQSICSYSQETGNSGGNGSVCNAIVGQDLNSAYEVAVMPSGCTGPLYQGCTNAQNVYQGKVGDYGVNTVTFYNVPVLPPATSGVSRTFRITNIRVPVPGGQLNGTLQATLSTNPNQTLPVSGTAINIGVVGPAMTAAVKQVSSAFAQCIPATVALSASLIFTEGFATGFKTRVVPGGQHNGNPGDSTGNTTWAAEGTNTGPTSFQNIPGGLYGGFSANTESGLILPGLTTNNTGTGSINYTAGLADYGTRLRALFYNIPSGLTMYVSTVSAGGPTTPWGGTSVTPAAVLVATSSGESTPDGTNFSPIAATNVGSGGTVPGTSVGTLPIIALSANANGVAEAVWEVVNSNPSAIDSLTFGVYIAYKPTAPNATNLYGTPITSLPLGTPANDVVLSFADDPTILGISTANATQGDTPTPRFAVLNYYQGPWTTINLCQTTLLYPFVTGASGFDTGIAVANTSWDPFGTLNQTGSCKLWAYGVTVAAAGNTPLQTTVPGCDSLANPVAGTNCFPIVAAGQVQSVLASATLTNFQGYVIATCNFYYAHGYAAVTDLGIRNLWSSYLALELSYVGIGAGSTRGTQNGGPQGIETLAH